MRTLIHLGWALHLTDTPVPAVHRHHAIQATMSPGHALRLLTEQDPPRASASGWIVGPGMPHGIDCDGPYAVLLIEPHARCADGWRARLGGQPQCRLEEAEARELALAAFRCWRDGEWDVPAAQALVETFSAASGFQQPFIRDRRVRALVQQLHEAPAVSTSLRELAESVGLSESRVAHLFREQVGLPLRSYRVWLRMRVAAALIASGHSATEAAHRSGFSDSAHLSRTCQQMFGLSPSRLPEMSFRPH